MTAITAAEIQSDDPERLAARWSEIAEIPVERVPGGNATIQLKDATLRFVKATDGRGEGLGGIDVKVADRERLLSAARARGAYRNDEQVYLCGMRVNLR